MNLLDHDRPIIYSLEQVPKPGALALLSLQWLMVLVPGLLVLGEVVASVQGLGGAERVAFLQRMFLVFGLVQAAQVLGGHRLPGLVGPSAVLMVGVISSMAQGPAQVYGGMLGAACVVALVGLSGLAAKLAKIFTRPVLGSTLILIAMSLTPAMRDLLFDPGAKGGPAVSFFFGLGLVLVMAAAQHLLRGLWSSVVLVLGLVLGSAAYHLTGLGALSPPALSGLATLNAASLIPQSISLHPQIIAVFALCYLAVVSNELATVEALGDMARPADMPRRANGAVLIGGLGGVLAGVMGVPGPVTYSVSPAVAISSRSLSRYTLLPAAGALVLMSFWPGGLSLFALAPPPVVGAVLFLLMASTVFAAIGVVTTGPRSLLNWRSGIILGCAMLSGLLIALMPGAAKASLPPALLPLLGNGFVVGLLVALIMEHLLLRRRP